MKKIVFFLMLIVNPVGCLSQHIIKIDSLHFHNVIELEFSGIIDEGFGEGPYVHGYFTLYNNTENPFVLEEPFYSISFLYQYEEKEYGGMFAYWGIKAPLMVPEHDSVKFECGANLMLDVTLHKSQVCLSQTLKVLNHLDIITAILPTLYSKMKIGDEYVYTSTIKSWTLMKEGTEYGSEMIVTAKPRN